MCVLYNRLSLLFPFVSPTSCVARHGKKQKDKKKKKNRERKKKNEHSFLYGCFLLPFSHRPLPLFAPTFNEQQQCSHQKKGRRQKKRKKSISFRPESNQRPCDTCVLYSHMLYQLSYRRYATTLTFYTPPGSNTKAERRRGKAATGIEPVTSILLGRRSAVKLSSRSSSKTDIHESTSTRLLSGEGKGKHP